MTVSELRKQVKKRIDHLGGDQLRSAADYVAYLDELHDPEAINLVRQVCEAERQVARGQVTAVSKLKRKF